MELIVKTSREIADTVIPKQFQEEIIRCRDCKYLRDKFSDWCDLHGSPQIDNNGFCAWAERVD